MKFQKHAVNSLVVLLSILAGTCLGTPLRNAPQILVELGRAGEFLTVAVTNASDKAMRLPGLNVALSKGARGLYLSIADASGKLYPTCALIDLAYTNDYVVPSRGYLQTNISIELLKQAHCLSPGKYTITATYAVKNDWAVSSFPITITIGK